MADHTFTLTADQETGWQIITDRVNAQRSMANLPPQKVDDVILEQLTTTGDREKIKADKAAMPMTHVNTVDDAVAKLAAMGYTVQAPR
jgi:hypothetical protein